jgi:uncharacterized membrane protein
MLNLAFLMMFQVWNTKSSAGFNLHGLICQVYTMEIIDDILLAGGQVITMLTLTFSNSQSNLILLPALTFSNSQSN